MTSDAIKACLQLKAPVHQCSQDTHRQPGRRFVHVQHVRHDAGRCIRGQRSGSGAGESELNGAPTGVQGTGTPCVHLAHWHVCRHLGPELHAACLGWACATTVIPSCLRHRDCGQCCRIVWRWAWIRRRWAPQMRCCSAATGSCPCTGAPPTPCTTPLAAGHPLHHCVMQTHSQSLQHVLRVQPEPYAWLALLM
jgi:hypothetical protein